MTRLTALALVFLVACSPGSVGPEESLPDAGTAVEPAPPPATDDDLSALRGVLRPIDSPLPDRATLERITDEPASALRRLMASDDAPLVRQNAARLLGLFPEEPGVATDLLEAAEDPSRPPALRTAALEGFATLEGRLRDPHRERVFALAADEAPTVAVAAIGAARGLEGATRELEALHARGDAHPAVVPHLDRALGRQ